MSWYPLAESIVRLVAAIFCGALIGLEREKRFKNAGIRTHVIVALASALMMIVSKYGFFDVLSHESISLDPSRIAAGVVSAIGFLGAGVIILRGDSAALGLTTAAGLWATVGVGIALGAGMYALGIIATVMMLIVQFVLHIRWLKIMKEATGEIVVNLSSSGMTVEAIREKMKESDVQIRTFTIRKGKDGDLRLTAHITFNAASSEKVLELMKASSYIEDMSIHMI